MYVDDNRFSDTSGYQRDSVNCRNIWKTNYYIDSKHAMSQNDVVSEGGKGRIEKGSYSS